MFVPSGGAGGPSRRAISGGEEGLVRAGECIYVYVQYVDIHIHGTYTFMPTDISKMCTVQQQIWYIHLSVVICGFPR